MTATICLPGLLGSHPLGALAAFGLLRWLHPNDPQARLRFELRDDWVAVVESARFADLHALIDGLSAWARDYPTASLLGWAEDVRISPHAFRALLDAALENGEEALERWLGSLVADGAIDRSAKAAVKPSAFYMVSGQQKFLAGLKEIVARVQARPEASFSEALAGPWRYQTRSHSLGWDPGAERVYALRGKAPTSEKPVCIPAAVLLATQALDLLPAVSHRGFAQTAGFIRDKAGTYFQWPVCAQATSLATLRTLLHSQALWRPDFTPRQGIAAVYRSRRMEFGQGYAVLRPAQPYQPSTLPPRKARR